MDLSFLLNNNYDYDEMLRKISATDKVVSKNTTFYANVYQMPDSLAAESKERRKYSYSKMGRDYTHFNVCALKIDEYLGLKDFKLENENIANIVKIAKPLYAEAKLAYDLLAKYWNMYTSGVDGQAIMLFFGK